VSNIEISLPAEWEAQDGILLMWPTEDSDWAENLADIEEVFIQLASNISRFEQVIIACSQPQAITNKLSAAKANLGKIHCYPVRTNDTWARDCGPITIYRDHQPVLYDYGFNGWGLKFAADQDNMLSRRLHEQQVFAAELITQGLILEGGSIESDGAGTLLTTSQCLLSPNRNPQLDKEQLENILRQQLGSKHVLWLDYGYLAGDDTDSHIDTLARLCPNDTIVYTACDDPNDEHFAELHQMEEQLKKFTTIAGKPFNLCPLPWPQAQFAESGERLPATYANFLIINGAVLVPIYADPADTTALELIAEVFPDHEIIAINCNPVIVQHGSLHCLTMQLAQGVLA
jgi:agmatine deiminase